MFSLQIQGLKGKKKKKKEKKKKERKKGTGELGKTAYSLLGAD